MKTLLLSLTCVTGLVASAGAQVFQPQTARNILIGSVAGAIIGENNDKPLEGALIGAAAGALWSAATVPSSNHRAYAPPAPQIPVSYETSYYPEPVCHPAPTRVVVIAPPRCEPPRRTVVVCRPPVVVVDPCPPRRVVHSHGNYHNHGTVVVRQPAHHRTHGHDRVVYTDRGYGRRR